MIFYSLYYFSFLSFHFTHTFFFFFFPYAISSTHIVSLSPPPSFPFSPSFKSPALLPKNSPALSLFFSNSLSLVFFFFFFHTLSLYLYPPSFICFVSLMRNSHSLTLAFSLFLFSFSFYLIPEGIMDKVFFISFSLKLFLPIWGDEICGPGKENFFPGFPLSLFFSLSQIVENTVFHSIFCSMFSNPPKITPTKHSVSLS